MNALHKLLGQHPPDPSLVDCIQDMAIDMLCFLPGVYEAWWALRTKALQEFRRWV